jgi:predicted helicase
VFQPHPTKGGQTPAPIMNWMDRFIVNCPSFEEFRKRASALPVAKDRGDVFERLTQVYLQTAPEYRTALKKVWLLRTAPARILAEIGLPRDDVGIDLIARHRSGMYWTIQAKFRSDEKGPLGWGDLSTFTALSAAPRQNIALTVVAHPIARPVGRRELMHNFVEIGLDRFRQADWSLIRRTILENAPARPTPSTPTGRFDWQQTVIDKAARHFRANARGRAQLPCGTGKSLIAYFIAEALKARTIIVAVQSLNLIKQTAGVWLREEVARGRVTDWLCIASDDSVGNADDIADDRSDLGLPTTTDENEIADWLRQSGKRKVVFTTYQSSAKLAQAAETAGAASTSLFSTQDLLNGLEIGPVSENFHVDSAMSAGERKELLDQFIQYPVAVMSNARCLTEGIDVPGIDAVVFASPKESTCP